MRKTEEAHKIQSYEQLNDAITPHEYGGLQAAYDHFNKELFEGVLPDVFITYQRHAHSAGYYSPDRFSGRVGQFGKDELALNPDNFIGRTDKQITSTLVHEQTHAWQKAFGTPASRGYHNKEWAKKMKEIGLQPSSTSGVGGRETGQHMSHYIIPHGAFDQAYERLAATGWALNLQSAPSAGPKGGRNRKTSFACTGCGQKAWGKPSLDLICHTCLLHTCQAVQEAGYRLVLLAHDDGTIEVSKYDQKILADKKPAVSVELEPLQCVDGTNEELVKAQTSMSAAA
jgi:hypothetical protein